MEYVYKYVDEGVCKYVGITNDMQKRFYQHTKDKLNEMKNPDVFYFPVYHRGDADMLETYLINYYKTGNYYNVSKTKKGDFSFLDICDRLPWVLYDGSVDCTLEPFSVSGLIGKKNTEVIYKPIYKDKIVYVDKNDTDAQIAEFLHDYYDHVKKIDKEISIEVEIINLLIKLIDEVGESIVKDHYAHILKGKDLHNKKLSILKQYRKEIDFLPVCVNSEKAIILRHELNAVIDEIDNLETWICKKNKY